MTEFIKYKKVLLAVFAVNVLLVSTHEGEFWPFSIFPMFSQAGNPWSRGLVQEIEKPDDDIWNSKSLEEIRPNVISLDSYGIDQIDYANFISKSTDWNEKRLHALLDMLQANENITVGKYWLITKVEGHLTEEDSVVVKTLPLFLVSSDTLVRNPNIFQLAAE